MARSRTSWIIGINERTFGRDAVTPVVTVASARLFVIG